MLTEDMIPTPKGHWLFEVYEGDIERDQDGNILNRLVERVEGENTVVDAGKFLLLDRLFGLGGPPAAVGFMGVGDSAAVVTAGQTELQAATNRFRKAFDSTPTRSTNVVTAVTTFATTEANFQWQELALFNSVGSGSPVTGGTMFNRIAPIGPFTKSSAVSIVATVTVTQS
ncbi:MAG: hypothetical protein LC792_03055 [Actinobacteria bacterium]|nr:hypothetical protein [Actinomycetota bacterium]